MDAQESESKFDHLEKIDQIELNGNLLEVVPSIKNMRTLQMLYLQANKITMIKPGDFAGAENLVILGLAGNRIVSAAPEAFRNLVLFRVTPDKFNPLEYSDGTEYRMGYGVGVWKHTGLGYFGATEWCVPPIEMAPNPVECVWVGPLVSDFDCSTCVLGYETTSIDNTTCTRPEFRPHRGWVNGAGSGQAQLQLQDTRGGTIGQDPDTGASVILTGSEYAIAAPRLEPKERKFVGYAQPYTDIRYELDFTLGAEVDIGCGTAVVGNGALDPIIPKDALNFSHPLGMYAESYQWPYNRANLKADPPDPGSFPSAAPRYHPSHRSLPCFKMAQFMVIRGVLCIPSVGQGAASRI